MEYTEADRYVDELAALTSSILNGTAQLDPTQAANYIYTDYGMPAGISWQQVQQEIGNVFGMSNDESAAIVYEAPTEPTSTTPVDEGTYTPSYTGPTTDELQDIDESYEATKKIIEKAKADGFISAQEARDALADNRTELMSQQKEGLAGNRAYFGAVSPDAYQSQIGTYNTKVKDAYQQGERTLDRNQAAIGRAEENIGLQYDQDVANAALNYNAAIAPTATGGYNYTPGAAVSTAQENVVAAPATQSAIARGGIPTAANYNVSDYNVATTPFDQWFRKQ